MTISLVIPCFNEAKRLDGPAFLSALEKIPGLRLVFVDDGSDEETLTVLRGLTGRNPLRLRVLSLRKNRGKAEAIRRGFLVALDDGPDLLGYWDADLATPLEDLPLLAAPLENNPEVQAVFGARVGLCGWDIRRTLFRHYAGRIFATAADFFLDLPVYDTQCGAKLFRVNNGLREAIQAPFHHRWLVDLELLLRLRRAWATRGLGQVKMALREVPLSRWHDRAGSKVGLAGGVQAGWGLFCLALRYGRGGALTKAGHVVQ